VEAIIVSLMNRWAGRALEKKILDKGKNTDIFVRIIKP